jgi:hypothetical protein
MCKLCSGSDLSEGMRVLDRTRRTGRKFARTPSTIIRIIKAIANQMKICAGGGSREISAAACTPRSFHAA